MLYLLLISTFSGPVRCPILSAVLPVLVLLLAVQLHPAYAARNPNFDHDLVPGWMGSNYQPPQLTPDTLAGRTRGMEVLHAEARIFLFRGFLTPDECDAIITTAEPRLQRSYVVSTAKSEATNSTLQMESKIRTSQGMFLARGENDVVKAVDERISAWTLLPVENGEGLQVLRYENKEKYEPHWDYFFHKDGTSNGGNRYATVLIYLSDVEEGGETVFPFIPAPGGENTDLSECARKYLAVKPRKGDAVLFHSIGPSGAFERRSMHGSCPVIKGTKWSMAKWLHVGRFAVGAEPHHSIKQVVNTIPSSATDCQDRHPKCDGWALSSECHKNPAWMVGDADKPGNCLQACRRCDVWKAFLEKQEGLLNVAAAAATQGAAEQKR